MKRPLGLVTLSYGGGLLLGEFFQPSLALLFAFSLGLAGLALGSVRWRPFLIWPLFLFTGWTNLVCHTAVISPHDLRAVQGNTAVLATVRGILVNTPEHRILTRNGMESVRTVAQLQVDQVRQSADWQPVVGRIVISTPGILPGSFFEGQAVSITGMLGPPPGPVAEGLFDYRAWLERQEIYYQLKTESSNDWTLVGSTNARPPWSDRFRAWGRSALARGLPVEDETLRLEWALSLGDKTVLTETVSEPFVRAATFHIFAVDGLRLAILFGIFFTLLRILRLPRTLCGWWLIPAIWFYTALTGWPASAIRAAVMLTVVIVGWALKRPADLVNSWFGAALVILLWDPQQLFQAGFQLSFVVVGCMILTLPAFDKFSQRLLQTDPFLADELLPRWKRILRPPARWLLDLLLTSTAAWLGSIPLAACYFHVLTPISAPANLIAVPLCALVLAGNFISLLLSGGCTALAEIFNHAGWFLMDCIRISSIWFAARPGACFYVPAPGLFTIILYYLILLMALTGWLFTPTWRRWKFAGLFLLSLIWGGVLLYNRSATRLTVLPLNGGFAVHDDGPGRQNDLLVDCGSSNAVEFVVKPFLRAQGVNRLSCLALTQGTMRQAGGAEALRSELAIERIAASSARFRSPAYRHSIANFQKNRAQWRELHRGDELNGWAVLHPDSGDHFTQADDLALVLKKNSGRTRILLLSNLGRAGQDALLKRYPGLRADIVVAGMPEKSEPLSEVLLDALHPRLIIVADSEFPAAHRAGAALRERLKQRGVTVIFTRDTGAATITLRTGRWKLDTLTGFHTSGPSGLDP